MCGRVKDLGDDPQLRTGVSCDGEVVVPGNRIVRSLGVGSVKAVIDSSELVGVGFP